MIWLRAVGGMPQAAVKTGAALGATLVGWRAVAWRADECAFRHGAVEEPSERARRATAVLAASLAPASFVVRAEPDRDTVLLHGIGGEPARANTEWLA